jgi:hypothetical protein
MAIIVRFYRILGPHDAAETGRRASATGGVGRSNFLLRRGILVFYRVGLGGGVIGLGAWRDTVLYGNKTVKGPGILCCNTGNNELVKDGTERIVVKY